MSTAPGFSVRPMGTQALRLYEGERPTSIVCANMASSAALIHRIAAALNRAAQDSARLEAVNFHQWGVWFNDRCDHFVVQERGQTVGNIGRGHTVYEAIDAAIARKESP